MAELKPCPFCGMEAVILKIKPTIHRVGRTHPFSVRCNSCDLYFGYDEDYGGEFDTTDEAADAWNRRAENVDCN